MWASWQRLKVEHGWLCSWQTVSRQILWDDLRHFLRCNALKVRPIKFSSLHSPLRAAHTSSWRPRKMLLCLGICLHSHHSSSPHTSKWLCTCVDMCWMIVYSVLCVSVCMYSVLSLAQKEGGSNGVSLAFLSFPQPFYMCNYIPPLIENRALPQSSLNKELLFPFCVYLHVCGATTTSYPWVFPLILSSRLIPYRKLITDWLGSCFPQRSHGPAWGSVWGTDGDGTQNN